MKAVDRITWCGRAHHSTSPGEIGDVEITWWTAAPVLSPDDPTRRSV